MSSEGHLGGIPPTGARTPGEGSDPDDPDGQMNDQEMPTTDGQMASGISEEVIPPTVEPRSE